MAYSTCPKCTSTSFEVKEAEPRHSSYKMIFVQCSSCGAVVGSMPYFDAGVLAKDNQTELTKIKQQLTQLEYSLSQVVQALRR